MNEKLDLILNKLESINKRFDKVDTDMREIKTTIIRMEMKLDSIQEQVARNSESITEILDGQVRQDRILEMLSKRSIEQEADIKDFKRMR